MIGVSLEKLVLVLVVVALVVGPARLPAYAERIGAWARGLRAFVDAARLRAETELGMPVRVDGWEQEVRRYDPRRIVRDALATPDGSRGGDADAVAADALAPRASAPSAPSAPSASEAESSLLVAAASAGSAAPGAGQALRWVVVGGSSGHPRRVRMAVAEASGRADAPARTEASAPASISIADADAAPAPIGTVEP